MDTTLKIALYGAIVSTTIAIKQLLDYRRDRADIKITVKGGFKSFNTDNTLKDKTYLRIDIVNRGRRPVIITSCSIKLPKGAESNWITVGDVLQERPKLNESEIKTYMTDEEQIHSYNLTDNDLVVAVTDAAGRYYWADNIITRWWKLLYCARKFKPVKKH